MYCKKREGEGVILIRMKVINIRKQPNQLTLVKHVFVDRQNYRNKFRDMYTELSYNKDEWPITVVNYYGVGGIGKSKLCKKIAQEANDADNNIQTVFYMIPEINNSASCLMELSNIIRSKYKIEFSLFELAYYIYMYKSGKPLESREVKSLIESSKLLNGLVKYLSVIPIAGIFANILEATDTITAEIRTKIKEHKEDIASIENDTAEELYQKLPHYFSIDMTMVTKYKELPMIIIVDNYENMVNKYTNNKSYYEKEKWLISNSGIINNIPKVIWILVSRERLMWNEQDYGLEEGKNIFEYRIEELSDTDTYEYLKIMKLEDEQLNKSLYDLTKGLPIYLYVCVEFYYELINSRKTPEINDFGVTKEELIERYTRYLCSEQQEILFMMSCMDRWDDDQFIDLLNYIGYQTYLPYYENLKVKSFVFEENKIRILHQVIGNILFKDCERRIIENCINYMEYQLWDKKEYKDFRNTYYAYLRCKLQLIDSYDELFKFLSSKKCLLVNFLDNYDMESFSNCYKLIYGKVYSNYKNTYLSGLLLYMNSKYMIICGNFSEALKLARRAWNILTYKGADPNILTDIREIMAQAYSKNGDDKEALRIRLEILEYLKQRNDNEKKIISVKHNIATSYLSMGDYDKALEIAKEVYTWRLSHNEDNPKFLGYTMSLLGQIMFNLNKLPEAMEWKIKANKYLLELNNRPDFESMKILYDMANILMENHMEKEALEYLEKVYNVFSKVIGVNNSITQDVLYRIGMAHSELGNKQKSNEILSEIREIYTSRYGESSLKVLGCEMEIALLISKEDDHLRALQLLLDIYEKTICNHNNKSTLKYRLAFNIGTEYSFLNNMDKAKEYYEIAYIEGKKRLGQNHTLVEAARRRLVKLDISNIEIQC